jgi:hypothetical protein
MQGRKTIMGHHRTTRGRAVIAVFIVVLCAFGFSPAPAGADDRYGTDPPGKVGLAGHSLLTAGAAELFYDFKILECNSPVLPVNGGAVDGDTGKVSFTASGTTVGPRYAGTFTETGTVSRDAYGNFNFYADFTIDALDGTRIVGRKWFQGKSKTAVFNCLRDPIIQQTSFQFGIPDAQYSAEIKPPYEAKFRDKGTTIPGGGGNTVAGIVVFGFHDEEFLGEDPDVTACGKHKESRKGGKGFCLTEKKKDDGHHHGMCRVHDHDSKIFIRCFDMTVVVKTGKRMKIYGMADQNGIPTTYEIDLEDNGDTAVDYFAIRTGLGYSSGGQLHHGDVDIPLQ